MRNISRLCATQICGHRSSGGAPHNQAGERGRVVVSHCHRGAASAPDHGPEMVNVASTSNRTPNLPGPVPIVAQNVISKLTTTQRGLP